MLLTFLSALCVSALVVAFALTLAVLLHVRRPVSPVVRFWGTWPLTVLLLSVAAAVVQWALWQDTSASAIGKTWLLAAGFDMLPFGRGTTTVSALLCVRAMLFAAGSVAIQLGMPWVPAAVLMGACALGALACCWPKQHLIFADE